MINSYSRALGLAIVLHLLVALLLFVESYNHNVKLNNQATQAKVNPDDRIIESGIVNTEEINAAINKIKAEKKQKKRVEQQRQLALEQKISKLKQLEIAEQKRLMTLKKDADKIALLRKKQFVEEERNLKQLVLKKEQQLRNLNELEKKKQQLQRNQQEEALKLQDLQHKKELLAAEQAKENLRIKAAAEAKIASEIEKYKALILSSISRNWILPENIPPGAKSKFRINLSADGGVLTVILIQSSGDVILDRSAQTAIFKASPLPVPTDPAVFSLFRDITLTVRPETFRG